MLPVEHAAVLGALTGDVSAYVAGLVGRRVRHHLVGEHLRRYQREHGGFTAEELDDVRAELDGAAGPPATVVLDSRALTDWIGEDRKVLARFALYHSLGAEFVISVGAVTGALAGLGLGLGLDRAQPGAPATATVTATATATAALHRALSRLDVEPVTEAAAWAAVELLDAADLHGDSYALKATVVESALRRPAPVILLTSDVGDMTALCGGRAGSVRMIGL